MTRCAAERLNQPVGLADRDYMRAPPPRRSTNPMTIIALVAAVVFLLLSGTGARAITWLRSQGPHNPQPEWRISYGQGVGVDLAPPPKDDPWKSYLAPENVCPGQTDSDAPPAAQEQAAICLLNYARERQGLAALPQWERTSAWSALKAGDIARCEDFSHTPCGEPFARHARGAGFTGGLGENIAMSTGVYMTALDAVDGWLNSEHHRENLFRRGWERQGMAVLHLDEFDGRRDAAIWVSEFAS